MDRLPRQSSGQMASPISIVHISVSGLSVEIYMAV